MINAEKKNQNRAGEGMLGVLKVGVEVLSRAVVIEVEITLEPKLVGVEA